MGKISDRIKSMELEERRKKLQQLAAQAQAQGAPGSWFETVYRQANGETTQIPWAKMKPHPILDDWFDSPIESTQGKKALVIGCGLGDDAQLLADKGFKVTAFDISPSAIAWCRQRFPHSPVEYLVADLLSLDSSWHQRFDFVLESRTIQSLPLSVRNQTIQAIANLVNLGGNLLVITHVRQEQTNPAGPPWPLSHREIAQFEQLGFTPIKRVPFIENEVEQICLEYVKNPR